jgi:hypothetical protein
MCHAVLHSKKILTTSATAQFRSKHVSECQWCNAQSGCQAYYKRTECLNMCGIHLVGKAKKMLGKSLLHC